MLKIGKMSKITKYGNIEEVYYIELKNETKRKLLLNITKGNSKYR